MSTSSASSPSPSSSSFTPSSLSMTTLPGYEQQQQAPQLQPRHELVTFRQQQQRSQPTERHVDFPRLLQPEQDGSVTSQAQCIMPKQLDTGINENADVPPFVGMMFVMTATTDVRILSLDVDVRNDLIHSDEDKYVEVYVYDGEYIEIGCHLDYRNNPDEWQLVYSGIGVQLSYHSNLILPAPDFSPIHMNANDRKSLYITMKGPWLDHTVDALNQRGEFLKNARGNDLNLLVGSGLSDYFFPSQIDPIVDPQFAGVIYFDKLAADCSELTTSSTADYLFLFKGSYGGDMGSIEYNKSIENLIEQVNMAIAQAINTYASEEALFQEYQSKYQLSVQGRPQGESQKFKGTCPKEWERCTDYYLHSRVTFRHSDSLNKEAVLYELYKEQLTSLITKTIDQTMSEASSYYLGLTSLQAKYEINLLGVDPRGGGLMDPIQKDWFADTTSEFLNTQVDPNLAGNFDVTVTDQELVGSRRRYLRIRRHLQEGTGNLKVSGLIRGGRFSFREASEFDNTVGEAFQLKKQIYMEMLGSGGLRPGAINKNGRYEYFASLNDVIKDEVTYIDNNDEGGGDDIVMIAIIVAVFGGLAGIVGLYFLHRNMRNRAAHKKNLAEYRENRVIERQRRKDATQLLDDDDEKAPGGGSGGTGDDNSKSPSDENSSGPESRRPSVDRVKQKKRRPSTDAAMAAAKKERDEEVIRKLEALGIDVKKEDNSNKKSLGNFLDEKSQNRSNHLRGSRSVDGGGFSRRAPGRSKSDDLRGMDRTTGVGLCNKNDGKTSLSDFMDKRKPRKGRMSGSKSVDGGDFGRRAPGRSQSDDLRGMDRATGGGGGTNKNDEKTLLSGFVDNRKPRKGRMSGSTDEDDGDLARRAPKQTNSDEVQLTGTIDNRSSRLRRSNSFDGSIKASSSDQDAPSDPGVMRSTLPRPGALSRSKSADMVPHLPKRASLMIGSQGAPALAQTVSERGNRSVPVPLSPQQKSERVTRTVPMSPRNGNGKPAPHLPQRPSLMIGAKEAQTISHSISKCGNRSVPVPLSPQQKSEGVTRATPMSPQKGNGKPAPHLPQRPSLMIGSQGAHAIAQTVSERGNRSVPVPLSPQQKSERVTRTVPMSPRNSNGKPAPHLPQRPSLMIGSQGAHAIAQTVSERGNRSIPVPLLPRQKSERVTRTVPMSPRQPTGPSNRKPAPHFPQRPSLMVGSQGAQAIAQTVSERGNRSVPMPISPQRKSESVTRTVPMSHQRPAGPNGNLAPHLPQRPSLMVGSQEAKSISQTRSERGNRSVPMPMSPQRQSGPMNVSKSERGARTVPMSPQRQAGPVTVSQSERGARTLLLSSPQSTKYNDGMMSGVPSLLSGIPSRGGPVRGIPQRGGSQVSRPPPSSRTPKKSNCDRKRRASRRPRSTDDV